MSTYTTRSGQKRPIPAPVQPFTVLLLYPDGVANNYGEDTYTTWVEGENIDDAVRKAQAMAAIENEYEGNPNDFAPLFICKEHIENLVDPY